VKNESATSFLGFTLGAMTVMLASRQAPNLSADLKTTAAAPAPRCRRGDSLLQQPRRIVRKPRPAARREWNRSTTRPATNDRSAVFCESAPSREPE
jgi:hypothetical protein